MVEISSDVIIAERGGVVVALEQREMSDKRFLDALTFANPFSHQRRNRILEVKKSSVVVVKLQRRFIQKPSQPQVTEKVPAHFFTAACPTDQTVNSSVPIAFRHQPQ